MPIDSSDWSGPSCARRELLAAVGATGVTSASGCLDHVPGGESGSGSDGEPAVGEGGPPDPDAWAIAFEDTFDDGELDTDVWELGYGPSVGHDCSFASCTARDHVRVDPEHDRLVLETSRRTPDVVGVDWADWTTGAITTGESFEQAYGYFEAKAKVPARPGGLPAFWAWTAEGNPPEIDVYEVVGHSPSEFAVHVHYDCTDEGDLVSSGATKSVAEPVDETFHVVGCAWTPEHVAWYVDGEERHRVDGRIVEECLDPEPMFPVLSTHVVDRGFAGDPTAASYPYTHEFEWVRVWRHEDHEEWVESS